VYRETLDDVVGLVHAKDILAGLRSAKGGSLRAVLRPAVFVPGTREVEDVLADMKRQKIHLAIVLDEFGGTAGLVTMEDLLEEIVGQIYDEYDRPSGELRAAPAGVAPIIAGSVPIREVNSAFGLELGEQDYTTIGGKWQSERHVHTRAESRDFHGRHPDVVIGREHGVELALERPHEHGVRRQRPGGAERPGRGLEQACVLVAEQAGLAGMGIEGA